MNNLSTSGTRERQMHSSPIRKKHSHHEVVSSPVAASHKNYADSEISHYFQRQQRAIDHSVNLSQKDNLISEEDLLSNADRISKFIGGVQEPLETDNDGGNANERLQLVQLNYLLQVKDNQIELLQSKLEEMENLVEELQCQLESKMALSRPQ